MLVHIIQARDYKKERVLRGRRCKLHARVKLRLSMWVGKLRLQKSKRYIPLTRTLCLLISYLCSIMSSISVISLACYKFTRSWYIKPRITRTPMMWSAMALIHRWRRRRAIPVRTGFVVALDNVPARLSQRSRSKCVQENDEANN